MIEGIIELSDKLSQSRPLRHLRGRKIRSVDQMRAQHTTLRALPHMLGNAYRERVSLRLGLEKAGSAHLLQMVWNPLTEHVIDVLGAQLFAAVHRLKVKHVFIDGLSGFRRALDDFPERLRGVFVALTEEFARRGVTTVFVAETPALFGPTIEVPSPGTSASSPATRELPSRKPRPKLRRCRAPRRKRAISAAKRHE